MPRKNNEINLYGRLSNTDYPCDLKIWLRYIFTKSFKFRKKEIRLNVIFL